MKLCVWAPSGCVLAVVLLLSVPAVRSDPAGPRERHYYIAAVEVEWNYAGDDTHRPGSTYKKVVFREYDKDFKQAKARPPWLGVLGPTLRAQQGDTLLVTFRNLAGDAYSLHPHGVSYGKQSEGANYFDNTSQKEKEDDVVPPGGQHQYVWEVTDDVSPQPADPPCLTYTYTSHRHVVEDFNTGLVGALLVCKAGSLDESGQQVKVHQELVFLFGVFDERESRFKPTKPGNHVQYSINGFTQGALPGVSVCAHSSISLHLLALSSEPEVFSVHVSGQVMQHGSHKVSSVGLSSGTTATASMVAVHPGRWMLSSHTLRHLEAGMHAFMDVKKCDGFDPPRRRMTIAQKRQSREWVYHIAAEEVIWDYAPKTLKTPSIPNVPNTPSTQEHIHEDFKLQYLKQSPSRIGAKYKKAVYTLYTNDSFTERKENQQRKEELGILGPVIRAQIRDVITVVFKNMASRPYSIYPHGLTIDKSEEGVNYPEGGNHSHAVQPGETHTYTWRVVEEDEPLEGDPSCLTRFYHSAVDTPRDIASGLVGPLLICKSQSLNVRNVQLKADKEQQAMFAVFDENRSWYLEENIRRNCDPSRVSRTDPDFYRSNVMHTINGYVFETGPLLGFCNGEVATWHVSSMGAQDYIQTATFYGHPFELNKHGEDLLSLYPMTGETIKITMDNVGIWLLASLNSHETTKGMRLKFQDVECYRDYTYEYEYEDLLPNKAFNMWKPPTLDDIKEEEKKVEEEKKAAVEEKKGETDSYTLMFAEELGLRSLKNQSGGGSVELLDLSVLDYDVIDVPDGDVNNILKPTKKNHKDKSNISKPGASSNTLVPKREDVRGGNGSAAHLDDQSFSHNPINQNRRGASLDHSSGNTTTSAHTTNWTSPSHDNSSTGNLSSVMEVLNDNQTSVETVVVKYRQKNESMISSFPEVVLDDFTITETDLNVTAPSVAGNGSAESTDLTLKQALNSPGNSTSVLGNKQNSVNLTDQTMFDTDSQEELTRGDAFSSSVQPSKSDQDGITDGSTGGKNLSSSSVKILNKTDDSLTNSIENVTVSVNSSHQNVKQNLTKTGSLQNATEEVIVSDRSKQEELAKSAKSSSEELGGSYSSEEVFIYLKENKSEAIKTTSLKTQHYNWTYEGTHHVVPEEIPDHAKKYFEEKATEATPRKKVRHVNLRQRPQRGQGMKTRRKKEYKPQARSGLPFSPRGFNPGMSPRGSRPMAPQPVSEEEEELINEPVVIGVPRPDFSDYELYVMGGEPEQEQQDEQDVQGNEYEYVSYKDPYSSHEDIKDLNLDETAKYYLKLSGNNVKTYFIAAEEVRWDYAGYGHKRPEKTQQNEGETKFTKVVFRGYMDGSFRTPDIRGETDEHLGILGPVIKAEIGQNIMVVFKNKASRPYSLHPNGVSYTKLTEGLSYNDDSKYWYQYDNEVQPNTTFTYLWKVGELAGPKEGESDCRTWVYYSGVNPEKDINSGLIGPLLVCRKGTLENKSMNSREFTLLFMTFDESQSWYYDENQQKVLQKTRRRTLDPSFQKNLKFPSINGIVYSLKGLRMYTNQLVSWHLINMGAPRDVHAVHFHGQTFLYKKTFSHRQAVFPLLPGSFATLEMIPSKPGLWQLETEVGFNQQKGMQTLFLVLDNDCYRPLGLESSSVQDNQITAINTRGYWEPWLARLNNQGKYNAWSTDHNNSWIQVDFQRPVVISQVATQGAKQMFQSQFISKFSISYSNDRRKWIFYKGDSRDYRKVFNGNQEAYETTKNTFFPPMVGRYVRLHPIAWNNMATVRMELYGCELDGCSVPLGMQSGLIEDRRITASSFATSWYSGPWRPELARLDRQGTINAWRAKYNDQQQWLQVELPQVKKITGIVTQGAKSLGSEMFLTSFLLQYSDDGVRWEYYNDDQENQQYRVFKGNSDNNDHMKNYIYPPIFSRFVRIVPRQWVGSITLRMELLGCDFE